MKRIFAFIALAILLTALLGVTVYAEDATETTTTATEQETPMTTPPTEESPAEGENDAQEGMTASQYFNEKILPLLTSSGIVAVGYIAMNLATIKSKLEAKGLRVTCSGLNKMNADLKAVIENIDLNALRDEIIEKVSTDIKDFISAVELDNTLVASYNAQMELMRAQIQTLINGAMNAWAQSPAAVACLSTAPTESAVRDMSAYIIGLENYVKQTKGEEAEQILSELKGV